MTTELENDADRTGHRAVDPRPAADAWSGDRRRPSRRQRAEAVIVAVFEDAERIKRREVDEALRTLEARGDLTDGERAAIVTMADTIVARLLAVPARSLRKAAGDGQAPIEAALDLFEPDPWPVETASPSRGSLAGGVDGDD